MKISLQNMAVRSVDALKQDNVSDVARVIYQELSKRKQLNQIERFIKITKQKYYLKEGLALAEATTAIKLSDDDMAQLKKRLEKRMGGKIALENIVDPQIIGGVKVRIDDETIDLSYRGLLEKLNSKLAGGV